MSDEAISSAARALGVLGGSKGGHARAANLSPERRSEIARQAAQKRWGTEPKHPEPMTNDEWREAAQKELAKVRHQLRLLRRKEKALLKFLDGLAVLMGDQD